MKVKRNTLLLLVCLVWSAAGVNILRVGLMAYPAYRTVWNFVLSGLVFAVFQIFVFGKLVKKHTARITAYLEERHFFLKFFDKKYSGSPVGRRCPCHWYADDSQNVCLCMDGTHWIFCYEKRMLMEGTR